jgi:hypothetical protein
MNKIELIFKVTECNGWPKLKFLLDLDLIEDYTFTAGEAKITIPIDLVNGKHILFVEFYGKTNINTKVDNDNNILQDQIVELVDIYVDDVLLPNFYKWIGVYKFGDQTHPQALKWGCNGIWSWSIEVPLISWLLEKKIEQDEKYNKSEMSYYERCIIAQEKIQQLENDLKKIQNV